MKKVEVMEYNNVKYHYIINYLFFSDDISKSFEEIKSEVDDIIFLDVLNTLRFNLFSNSYYPNKVFQNFEKLLDILEKHYSDQELIEGVMFIKNNYSLMEKKEGYQVYLSEFENKINTINDYNNTSYLWDKKQMEALFEFDCAAILSFMVNSDIYLDKFFPNYICNQNYLYFIQKILIQYPELFLNNIIKQKVINILEYNKLIVENMDMDKIIEEFTIKNNNLSVEEIKSDYSRYLIKFANFMELSDRLLIRIKNINKNNFDECFNAKELVNLYYHTFIEKQFVERDDIPSNPMFLDAIYNYIDEILVGINDYKINKKIIDMMAECKETLPKKLTKGYNEHLLVANSVNKNGIGFISYVQDTKLDFFERLVMTHDINKYQFYDDANDLLDTLILDHDVIKSFMCDELEFETLYFESFVYSDDFVLTIRKLLEIYPNLFTDFTIHERTVLIFNEIINKYKAKELNSKDFYKKNVKTLKKVEKIYYGK